MAKRQLSDEMYALVENLKAYIKLVYPAEMTPQAKRILEQIIERHETGHE